MPKYFYYSSRAWPVLFLFVVVCFCSEYDLLVLLCFSVGLPAVVQIFGCPDPSLCPWLKMLPMPQMPLSLSSEYLLSFQESAQAFPPLGILFSSYQSSITSKQDWMYWILCSYSIIALGTYILDYWFCFVLPNCKFLQSKGYVLSNFLFFVFFFLYMCITVQYSFLSKDNFSSQGK